MFVCVIFLGNYYLSEICIMSSYLVKEPNTHTQKKHQKKKKENYINSSDPWSQTFEYSSKFYVMRSCHYFTAMDAKAIMFANLEMSLVFHPLTWEQGSNLAEYLGN